MTSYSHLPTPPPEDRPTSPSKETVSPNTSTSVNVSVAVGSANVSPSSSESNGDWIDVQSLDKESPTIDAVKEVVATAVTNGPVLASDDVVAGVGGSTVDDDKQQVENAGSETRVHVTKDANQEDASVVLGDVALADEGKLAIVEEEKSEQVDAVEDLAVSPNPTAIDAASSAAAKLVNDAADATVEEPAENNVTIVDQANVSSSTPPTLHPPTPPSAVGSTPLATPPTELLELKPAVAALPAMSSSAEPSTASNDDSTASPSAECSESSIENPIANIVNFFFTPGITPAAVTIMNLSFAGLFACLFFLLFATGSWHVVFLIMISLGLFGSVQWFLIEMKAIKKEEQEKKDAMSVPDSNLPTTCTSASATLSVKNSGKMENDSSVATGMNPIPLEEMSIRQRG